MFDFLVVAADGLVGNTIYKYLSQKELVVGTSRRKSAEFINFHIGIENKQIDLLFKNLKPKALVINCSAILDHSKDANKESVAESVLVNSLFPHVLAGECKRRGLRMLHISTNAVFGSKSIKFSENSPAIPTTLYGQTKLLGETRSEGVMTIRTSMIGPSLGASKHGLWNWINLAKKNTVLSGYHNHMWSGVTTLQIATLCEKLYFNDLFENLLNHGALHHFCPNDPISKFDLITKIAEVIRPDLKIEKINSDYSGDPLLISDNNKLNQLVGRTDWDFNIKEVNKWATGL